MADLENFVGGGGGGGRTLAGRALAVAGHLVIGDIILALVLVQ